MVDVDAVDLGELSEVQLSEPVASKPSVTTATPTKAMESNAELPSKTWRTKMEMKSYCAAIKILT